MAPFQKFIQRLYLHQNLVEEASIVLGQADLTQESYGDTWKRIQETYDNKRRQTISPLSEKRRLQIGNLKSLGMTMGTCEPLFFHLL